MNAFHTGLRPALLVLTLAAGANAATPASGTDAAAPATRTNLATPDTDANAATPASGTNASGSNAVAATSGATVHIKYFKFAPTPLTIHAGDRVTFVNDDDEAHTVTATDKSFDSEGLDGAGTWQHAFAKAGTYRYFCELHPYMKATIVVLPAAAPAN